MSQEASKAVGEFLGDLKEKAQDVLEAAQHTASDVLENAEQLADKALGEERVDRAKEILQTDVKDLAADAVDAAKGFFQKVTGQQDE